MSATYFSADRFATCDDAIAYVNEVTAADSRVEITDDEAERFDGMMRTFDPVRLALALAVAEAISPDRFAESASTFLTDPDLAVRVNASRVLEKAKGALRRSAFRTRLARQLAKCPEGSIFAARLGLDAAVDVVQHRTVESPRRREIAATQ